MFYSTHVSRQINLNVKKKDISQFTYYFVWGSVCMLWEQMFLGSFLVLESGLYLPILGGFTVNGLILVVKT